VGSLFSKIASTTHRARASVTPGSVAGKAVDIYDWQHFAEFDWLSGHNLNHLLAAGAAAMAVPSRRHS
jgi:hypothetical protein